MQNTTINSQNSSSAMKNSSFKSTIVACYIGNFTQAIIVNFTPIIFIPIKEQFGLSYGQFGLLIMINFITQVLVDIIASKVVDRHGFRPFAVAAHLMCVLGLILFSLTPIFFQGKEYFGFIIATLVFSSGGGLLELLLSPIIDAIPTKKKSNAMALLHSFYSWGQVAVISLTTCAIFAGVNWRIIVASWAVVPLVNIALFAKAPLITKHHGTDPMRIRHLIKNKTFILAFFAILFGGAAEVTMSQWTSIFMEKAIEMPKVLGDMIGFCGFAVTMGMGRMFFGFFGHKFNLSKILIYGSGAAIVCYVVVALSPLTWLSVTACVLSGFCVSLLWPGTLVKASEKLPLAGASMFALLAAGGDIGASLGPWITGVITDGFTVIMPHFDRITAEQFGLRAGIFFAAILPIISLIFQLKLRKNKDKSTE